MTAATPQPFQPGPRLIDGTDLNKNLALPAVSTDNGVTATGATRATAYALGSAITRFTTVAASTGAVLPASAQAGTQYIVYNDGASPLTVYASGSDTIDGTAGATGVALANAKRCRYTCLAAGIWISAQLGAVSA